MTIKELITILWPLVCHVESGNNPQAYNEAEKAAGIAQIRPCVVRDVNDIVREEGTGNWRIYYSLPDAYNPHKSREMFTIYLSQWGRHYILVQDKPATLEILARIWNGGPDGWRKETTLPYWGKIKQAADDTALYEHGAVLPGEQPTPLMRAANSPQPQPDYLRRLYYIGLWIGIILTGLFVLRMTIELTK